MFGEGLKVFKFIGMVFGEVKVVSSIFRIVVSILVWYSGDGLRFWF